MGARKNNLDYHLPEAGTVYGIIRLAGMEEAALAFIEDHTDNYRHLISFKSVYYHRASRAEVANMQFAQ